MATRTPRAFTLIELLVVISVIALLVAILLPVLGAARAAGRSAACLSNQRQIGVACYTYATEEDNYWPVEFDDSQIPLLLFAPPSGAWHIKLTRYLPDEQNSPANSYQLRDNDGDTVFHCPEWQGADPVGDSFQYPSYGISSYIPTQFNGLGVSPVAASLLLLDEVVNPSTRTFIIDFDNNAEILPLHVNTQLQYNDPNYDAFRYDHGEAANWLYYDGHAGSTRVDEVTALGQWVWAPRRPRIEP